MNTFNSFRTRWMLHCAAGELLGIGAAAGIAFGVNHTVGEPVTLSQKLLVLACMLLAGVIEGSLLGGFQWWVLRERIPRMRESEWIGRTVTIAVIGWLLGMLPSLFFTQPQTGSTPPLAEWDNPWLIAFLSAVMGLVVGALFGWFQWLALRKYLPKAGRWILANALGWSLGLTWIYLAASWPDAQTPFPVTLTLGIAGGVLAGLSVGAVTGIFLDKLTREASIPKRSAQA